uniref:substrate-binding domain-containing protein n=1 Tax=Nocardioides sp. TaxID=35761 RepID=UPI00286E9E33
MNRRLSQLLALLMLALLPGIATGADAFADGDLPEPSQRAAYAQIEGSGSTWSEVIVQQWISDVDALGMKVTYNGGGSSQGRKNFSQNVTDFGISEIPYPGVDEFGNADNSNGREFAYLPIVAGGTAFTYQLKIGD